MDIESERPACTPQTLVERMRRFARERERGVVIGDSIYDNLLRQMAWWVGPLDERIQQRLLGKFSLLANKSPDSPAYDHWLSEYQMACDPPKPWREALREEVAWRKSQWQNWVEHEVSPRERSQYKTCTPALMRQCLEIKGVLAHGRLQLDVSDEPPAEITEETVAELMTS